MSAGYSGTPLAKKLGIKPGKTLLFYNRPDHYWNLFSDVPENIKELTKVTPEEADFIHVFCTSVDELKTQIPIYKTALKKTGMLWVSWPKGSSKIPTDLKREPIREYLLDIGLVDIKVAAVDNDWSGLKFVYRVNDRL
ncbi:DUF3052 domain-containing protein [Aquimarina sp. BL5]|uniref:DUF3052 domain-containing protein n=1 Tax=Aquimarina sp. BL5 TaxID=1714860 RepID=UPI000E4FD1C8|nr:DUF3052 domain-containing protein [Aquimarina sp. BL5]AXT53955.1 DUF3052 domain-containing protein [Aquimarina sp. BL5]RKM89808.1 DUF3052 domain-containing protein [Aquimarina sp. BL5]